MFKSLSFIVFLLGTMPVAAQDCNNATSQPDLNRCAEEKYASADKELNMVYDSYRKNLDENGKKSLTAMQKQWLKFRDLACEHEARDFMPMTGAGAGPMVYAECLRGLTEAQTKLIQKWLKQEKL